jgi:hypothetical protein
MTTAEVKIWREYLKAKRAAGKDPGPEPIRPLIIERPMSSREIAIGGTIRAHLLQAFSRLPDGEPKEDVAEALLCFTGWEDSYGQAIQKDIDASVARGNSVRKEATEVKP